MKEIKNVKQLKDIPDMERYLKEDCYCPGEIYSSDRFFFRIFHAEDECELIGQASKDNNLTNGNYYINAVISSGSNETDSAQLLLIMVEDLTDKIGDIIRFDATENNIELIKEVIKNNKTERKFDEFKKGETKRNLKQILELSNGLVMID